jgi:lysyl-tRNA synthetase class 2
MVAETFLFPSSSNLDECDYDPDTDNLTIRFQSGDEYTYFNVPPSVYRGLTAASSAGEYFHRQIKGRYQYERS